MRDMYYPSHFICMVVPRADGARTAEAARDAAARDPGVEPDIPVQGPALGDRGPPRPHRRELRVSPVESRPPAIEEPCPVEPFTAVVIGAGPAGLAAAEALLAAGVRPVVFEAKPSVARKFLMAGKSGLNLTKDESAEAFLAAFGDAGARLAPMLAAFGPRAAMDWARGLGEEIFTGSSGRVFPTAMKGSPVSRIPSAATPISYAVARLRETWRFSSK